MVRRTRSHGMALAVALTVLGSAGTALVAVASGTGFGSEPSGPALSRVSGIATGQPGPAGTSAGTPGAGSSAAASGPRGPSLLASPAPPGSGVPTLPPAQPQQPNVVRRNGRTMLCPSGVEPMVQIHSATFSPELKDGSTFGVGRYRITVRGRVANDTTEPIELRSLQVTIDGRPWHQTSAVTTVGAQDFAPISFEGFYDSPAPHRAVVDSRLQWQWQKPGLRPCGQEGLLEDD